jgi:hypothetical protein
MAKVTSITEHYQHFLRESKESFWGDLYGQTQLAWKGFFELQSERERDRYSGAGRYEREAKQRKDYRNGYYERDFLTRFGTIRLRIARTRKKNFLPPELERFQRKDGARPRPHSAAFIAAGTQRTQPSWIGWQMIYQNYCRSSASLGICGGSCAPPM